MRDKRREGIEFDFRRKRAIFKVDMRQRIGAGEHRAFKSTETGNVVRSKAVLPREGRQQARLKNARHRLRTTGPYPNGRKGVFRAKSLIGPVKNLPVP